MKWEIVNNSPKYKIHKVGDIRFKTKFAWLPTRVISKLTDTDHMIWFELYIEEQEYKRTSDGWDYHWKTIGRTIHV